jgi:flagellar basal body-associated protein FliL
MAANLKNAPPPSGKKDEKAAGKPDKERWSPDWKWVALGLGFALTSIGATVLGVHFYAQTFLVKETVRKEYVLKLPPKPGPSLPLMTTQVVNLKGGRYLRFSVVMQYVANEHLWPSGGGGNAGSSKKVDPMLRFEPLMKDVVVSTVSRHTATELLEPEGRERLKAEIRQNINHELKAAFGGSMGEGHGEEGAEGSNLPEVLRVFFTEFVVS